MMRWISALGLAVVMCGFKAYDSDVQYWVIDSDEPASNEFKVPLYAWDDTFAGEEINFPNGDSFALVELPFPFWCFGQQHTHALIYPDGYLTLFDEDQVDDSLTVDVSVFRKNLMKKSDGPDPVGGAPEVRYQTKDSLPNRRFVITWYGMTEDPPPSPFPGGTYTFQVALYEAGELGSDTEGSIRMQYQTMAYPSEVMVEQPSVKIQRTYNSSYNVVYLEYGSPTENAVDDGLAVGFYPNGQTPAWPAKTAPPNDDPPNDDPPNDDPTQNQNSSPPSSSGSNDARRSGFCGGSAGSLTSPLCLVLVMLGITLAFTTKPQRHPGKISRPIHDA